MSGTVGPSAPASAARGSGCFAILAGTALALATVAGGFFLISPEQAKTFAAKLPRVAIAHGKLQLGRPAPLPLPTVLPEPQAAVGFNDNVVVKDGGHGRVLIPEELKREGVRTIATSELVAAAAGTVIDMDRYPAGHFAYWRQRGDPGTTAVTRLEGALAKDAPLVTLAEVVNPWDPRVDRGPRMPRMRMSVTSYAAGKVYMDLGLSCVLGEANCQALEAWANWEPK